MSDQSQGPGWWLASDGKWYPPHLSPGSGPSQPAAERPASLPVSSAGPPKPKSTVRRWRTWQLVTASLVCLLIGAGAGSASSGDDEEGDDGDVVEALEEDLASERERADEAEALVDELRGDLRDATSTTRRPATTTTTSTTVPPTTTTTAPPQPVEVGRFEGSTDTQTGNFTVSGNWSITAVVSGGAGIIVEILTPSGSQEDHVNFDPGQNTSQFRQGGTFYLDISTFGSGYTVSVVDEVG